MTPDMSPSPAVVYLLCESEVVGLKLLLQRVRYRVLEQEKSAIDSRTQVYLIPGKSCDGRDDGFIAFLESLDV